MAGNINNRLNSLRSRRDGSRGMAMDSTDIAKLLYPEQEAWEKRGSATQQHTRYALGAMQAVSAKYTQVSIDTANRVAKQLRERLPKYGRDVDFRLQGSVALNVHIRGASDVDLLVLDDEFYTYKTAGAKALRGGYTNPTTSTSAGVLSSLRSRVETELDLAYYGANVDKNGAKAVKLSGASLARAVDVVPSHWIDTIHYQATFREVDRGVMIFNKKTNETIENRPFVHIERIETRCNAVGGGLRKAIRLCKNVKEDSDRKITISSFDIASAMYHADQGALRAGASNELAILAEAQRHLDHLTMNEAYAKTLMVPDGTRLIFDSEEKLAGLRSLAIELDELMSNVYVENAPGILAAGRLMSEKRDALMTVRA